MPQIGLPGLDILQILRSKTVNHSSSNIKAIFFNEEGILNIDELVVNNASFIMEDGVITEDEIKTQSNKVVAMLHDMEAKYSEEQLADIRNLLVGICH